MVRLLSIVATAVLYPVLMWYQPAFVMSIIQRLLPDIVFQVPNKCNQFALTFDDGPRPPYTHKILDILNQYGAKATFFVIGKRLEENLALAQRIMAEGHELANHFYSGVPTFLLNKNRFLRSLTTTNNLLECYGPSRYARPAYGFVWPWNIDIAKSSGYTFVLGSAYPGDGWRLPRWYIRWYLKRMLRAGVIVVLHDGIEPADRAIAVLPDLLRHAAKLNLQAVSVGRLIESRTCHAKS